MKNNFLKYVLLCIAFMIIIEINNEILNVKDLLHHFLSESLTLVQVNSYLEFQDKWHWLAYVYIPVFILIKTLIITIILYVGLYLSNEDLKYKVLLDKVIRAEFIFLLVPIFKIFWFTFFQTKYDLRDIQSFYPLSALNIVGYKNLETWYIYPFQTLNLFELTYWLVLAYFLGKETKTNMDKGLKIVAYSYGPALLLWVSTVMFFTLNYS